MAAEETPTRALVRGISRSFARAIVRHAPAQPIDVERAMAQHRGYVEALRRAGLAVEELPPDEAHPDGCFVEDCALVVGGAALIARMGAPARRGEEAAVRAALARSLAVEEMAAPATLDGGDCLEAAGRLFIGRSSRTNEEGIARARAVFGPRGVGVTAVPVDGALHLKSVCSYLGRGVILLAEGTLPREVFRDAQVIAVPAEEAHAANAIGVGRVALVAAGCPATARAVERAGFEVAPLDTSEIRKADGALTCLSIRFR